MTAHLPPGDFAQMLIEVGDAVGSIIRKYVTVEQPAEPEPGEPDLAQPTGRGVTVKGTDLLIDGRKRQIAGWNMFGATGCHQGQRYSDSDLNEFFRSIPARSLTRCWGFRPQGLDALKHVLAAAERNDQLLIVSLGDGRSHCGDIDGSPTGRDGSGKVASWYQAGYKGAYRSWVDQVTREVGDHPAVGGFEPHNEPVVDAGILRAWVDDIGGLIKQNAPTKLVFSGQRAPYDFGNGLAGYKHVHASPFLDVLSLHEYDYDHASSRKIVSGWWSQVSEASRDLGKPAIIGEVGIGVPGKTGASQQTRANAMRDKIQQYFSSAASAVLVWNRYLGPSGESFAVTSAQDPLVAVIRDESR